MYVMSLLNNNCQKQKHVRYRRRSIVKEVQILSVMSIGPLHQQSDNSCKMQHENVTWSQVFICVGSHIVSLANHVTSEWMDVIVCVTCHLSPF
jgi:hypothetical protein